MKILDNLITPNMTVLAIHHYLNITKPKTRISLKIKIKLQKYYDCQTAKQPNLHTYVDMQSIKKKASGEVVALDCLGPLPSLNLGVRGILVRIDVFTKTVHLTPL